jgi:hypothetical protein
VEVEPYGEPVRKPATMDILYPGDTLRVGNDGYIMLVFFADKHTERLKPGCSAVIAGHGCEPARSVEHSKARIATCAGGKDIRALRINGRGAGVVFR